MQQLGDRVLDKSKDYVAKANDILNYLYQPQWWIPNGKKVRVNIDYKDYTKEDLLKAYIEQGGDLDKAFHESFSCYEPDEEGNECWCNHGICKPCFRKFVAFDSMGYKFPDEIIKNVVNAVNKEIIPDIKQGVYGRPTEEPYILSIVEKYKEYLDE